MSKFRRLFIDFDSFYASVEQQDNIFYRKKPLIVVPCLSDHTCAIAASYEAKALGIKTGTRVKDAKARAGNIIVVEARPKRYVEIHNQIVEVLYKHFETIQILSIDEMACVINEDDDFTCEIISGLLKFDLQEAIGKNITCSIGVARNVFLSKVAADFNKPNGFTSFGEDAEIKLKQLDLIDLPGIADKMETRLNKSRIQTVDDLFSFDELKLKKAWGSIVGARWWHMIRGSLQCDYGQCHNEVAKSFGHTHVLPPEKRDDSGAFEVFESLLYKAIERLNKNRVASRRVSIYLSWRNTTTKKRGTYKAVSPIALPSLDYAYWTQIALSLWNNLPQLDIDSIPLLVGVRFTRTIKQSDLNLQLFDLEWKNTNINHNSYNLPDRISFGDPSKVFEK